MARAVPCHGKERSAAARTSPVLLVAVMRGSWSDEASPDEPSAGEPGLPQLEARLGLRGTLSDGAWALYVVGHVGQKDLTGVTDV